MKFNWRIELPQLLLIAGMFVVAAATWSSAPDRIPIHWNLQGKVDGHGGKFMGLAFLPLTALGLYVLLYFLPRIDPGRSNYPGFAGPYGVIRLSLQVLLAAIYAVTHLVMRGIQVRMELLVPGLLGLLFIVLGAVMGKVRPNWFVGVRTPWTLSSKLSWTKTHRLAGWVFLLAGLAAVAGAFITPAAALGALLVGGIGGSLATVVYSYFVWRADPDKIAPAGTQPADEGQ